jgi:hypothetical protein
MGNCIGKKSPAQNKHRKRPHSTKLHVNNQRTTPPPLLVQSSAPFSHLSDIKEPDILFNNDEESEKKVVQYSSSLTTTNNGQFFLTHTPPTSSPDQLSVQCKKFKSTDTVREFSENSISLLTNEQDTTMGFLFSKEKEISNDQEVPELISGKK